MERKTGYKQNIVNILIQNLPGLQAVYLFGSLSSLTGHDASDVDIAVLLSPEQSKATDWERLFNIRCVLEKCLGKDVDLINLRRVDTVMQKEVLITGERIYCPDEYAADLFEMFVCSAYQKLCRERSGIVEEIIKSGRVLAS